MYFEDVVSHVQQWVHISNEGSSLLVVFIIPGTQESSNSSVHNTTILSNAICKLRIGKVVTHHFSHHLALHTVTAMYRSGRRLQTEQA